MMRKGKSKDGSSPESFSNQIDSASEDDDGQKGKKHRKTYSFGEKSEILKALETHSYQYVAEEYGVHVKMLRKWQKKRGEIEAAGEDQNACKRKKRRYFIDELDEQLHKWLVEARDRGIVVTDVALKAQALALSDELGGKSKFTASDAWLENWKKRMESRKQEICDKKIEETDDTQDTKKQRKKYTPQQREEILKALETQTYQSVSQQFGVDGKLLYRWKMQKETIENAIGNENSDTGDLHSRLHEWFVQNQLSDIPMPDSSLSKTDISDNEPLFTAIEPKIEITSDTQETEKSEIEEDNADSESPAADSSLENNGVTLNANDSDGNSTSDGQEDHDKTYTVEEKARILKLLETQSYEHVCEKYGVNIEMLDNWKRSGESAIENSICNKRKRSVTEESDARLYEWSSQAPRDGIPMRGLVLKKQALILKEEVGGKNKFRDSGGWLVDLDQRIPKQVAIPETSQAESGIDPASIIEKARQMKNTFYAEHRKDLLSSAESQNSSTEELHARLRAWFLQSEFAVTPLAEATLENNKEMGDNEAASSNPTSETHRGDAETPTASSASKRPMIPHGIISKENGLEIIPMSTLQDIQDTKLRRSYSYEQRNAILKMLETRPHEYVCGEYGINLRMLHKWQKQKSKIEAASSIFLKKKRNKSLSDELDNRLYKWSTQSKESGVSVTSHALKKQALIINKELGGRNTFKASEAWLENWKKRMEEQSQSAAPAPAKSILNNEKVPGQNDSGSDDIEDTKKHRKSYTFEQKNEILKALETQSSQFVSEVYGVHERMLSKWKKKKVEIEAAMENPILRKKKKKRIVTDELDTRLYAWSIEAQRAGISVRGPILKHQALIFNREVGGKSDFRASDGWLDGWKKRMEARLAGILEARAMLEEKGFNGESFPGQIDSESDTGSDIQGTGRNGIDSDTVDLHTRLHEWSIQAQLPGVPAAESMSEKDGTSGVNETKKHRKSYSFEEKAEILKLLEIHPLQYVAEEYGVNIRVLRKWYRKRDEIRAAMENQSLCRKRAKRASTEELDTRLYDWFVETRRSGITVTGPKLKKQALIFNSELGGRSGFRASDGWLDGWKRRKNIKFSNLTDEKEIS